MLCIVVPLAFIPAPIRPKELTIALLLVGDVFSLVLAAVFKNHHAYSLPRAALKGALVIVSVCPSKLALAIPFIVFVLPPVKCTGRPYLISLPILYAILPLALVLLTVWVYISAESMLFIILPDTIVETSAGIDQSTLTILFSVPPVSLVQGPIRPNNPALACYRLRADKPLATVLHAIGIRMRFSRLKLRILMRFIKLGVFVLK